MTDAVRRALEFAAEHMHSDWPERCQEIVRRARAALSEQPAPKTACKGIPRVGCNYLAECDSVCNKCGKVHAVHLIPGVGSTAPVERVQLSDTKPLDDPRLQQLFGDAIEGALAFGYQGENAAPPGHWLERFWHLGRAEAEKTLAATPPPMPARLNDQRIVELMRPLADDALIRPHVIAAARAAIAEHERLNGISATPRQPLSEARIEEGRHETFSTNNPFCPCDSKTMLKAVRWAERAHGITPAQGNGGE